MNYLTSKKFSFASRALTPDAFGVVSLKGTEGISQCYAFEVLLISDNKEIDLAEVVRYPATLTFHRDSGEDVEYHGILLSFEQLQEIENCALYRAYLSPRLFWLSFIRHQQVFLNSTVPEIIEACLKDAGLTSLDFDLKLQGSYSPLEYVCQYDETHLAFISRWCEREGIYYYFDQSGQNEKVVFTDSRMAHTPCPKGASLVYSPPSGLEAFHEKEAIRSFTCSFHLTPASVLLKDYNYMKPSLDITGSADVDANGRGQVYSYGDHIGTPEEGMRLAAIKAESLTCRREVFQGASAIPSILPGFTFDLTDHYRSTFNQSYLVTQVHHEGNQAAYLVSGLSMQSTESPFYSNSFTAIPSSFQFRPERLTPKPRISGSISAKVDAAGTGQYAELDEHGRYKVTVPFDTSGRKNGKASAWIRMATPYAGSDHGMHFPLHKDTEVLLTFIDGDPDRPIIASAVPNPENPSPVSSANQTKSIITTASGNKIHMEDQAGSERILMHVPNQQSFIRIGAHNDPTTTAKEADEYKGATTHWGIAKKTAGTIDIQAQAKNLIIFPGESVAIVVGLRNWFTLGLMMDMVFLVKWEIQVPQLWTIKNLHTDVNQLNMRAYAESTANKVSDTKISGMTTRVTGLVNQALGDRIRDELNGVDAEGQRVVVEGNRQTVIASKLEANVQKVKTVGTSLETLGNRLENAGMFMGTVGTRMNNTGLGVANAGSKIKNASTAIWNAGLAADTAAQIEQV